MTWQEQLQQLDAALAGGQISAEEHRRQRDEILASASSPQAGGWTPGAFSANTPHASIEQAFPSGRNFPQQNSAQALANDTERTQVVPAVTAGGPPPQGANGAPPWGGDQNFPPPPGQGWYSGPESFDGAKSSSGGKKGKLVAIIAAVVIGLAAVGAGVWWFVLRDTGATAGESENPGGDQQDAPPAPPEFGPDLLPALPGGPDGNSGLLTAQQGVDLGLYGETTLGSLTENGTERLVYSGSNDAGTSHTVLAFETAGPDEATSVADALVDVQAIQEMEVVTLDGIPEAVTIMRSNTDGLDVYRAVYTSGDLTIRVGGARQGEEDELVLVTEFQNTLNAVLDALPVD
ncbi:hypothetical protein [Actinoalloteichus spitiensis]|uniref:hypothetical protein n=1 Tax=Actinoalloteichus spitiensis TaxID=252394 RepID=UPI00037FDA35|nr:hypothetical protein [Actinoalloteichus spitiensis]